MNPTISTTSNYCPACDTITEIHICQTCHEYTVTIDEAMQAGFLMTIAPADCNCEICN